MNIDNLPTYCIANYQSDRGIDDQPSYNFWFTSSLIRLIGDKPFGRGDILYLEEAVKTNNNEWTIHCKVIGDPSIDKEAKELVEASEKEIPTLVFLASKIYLHEDADVHLHSTDNAKLVLLCSAVLNKNKAYAVVVLMSGKQGKIEGIDAAHGTPVEWLITDSPRKS